MIGIAVAMSMLPARVSDANERHVGAPLGTAGTLSATVELAPDLDVAPVLGEPGAITAEVTLDPD